MAMTEKEVPEAFKAGRAFCFFTRILQTARR
jgi:hypothetical protein